MENLFTLQNPGYVSRLGLLEEWNKVMVVFDDAKLSVRVDGDHTRLKVSAYIYQGLYTVEEGSPFRVRVELVDGKDDVRRKQVFYLFINEENRNARAHGERHGTLECEGDLDSVLRTLSVDLASLFKA